MGIRENYDKLITALKYLNVKSEYISGGVTKPYKISNIENLKRGIEILEDVDFLEKDIQNLKANTGLFDTYRDEDAFTSQQNTEITVGINSLKTGIRYLISYFQHNSNKEAETTAISVRLPDLKTFDDFNKIISDLKKSIELPIIDSGVEDGEVEILSAEQGSIWLMIGLGSLGAVKLIGGICWAAMVIRKKRAEAQILEAQVKTLDLKNEALDSVIQAQKKQLDNLLKAEAEAIASDQYNSNDPETIRRLELSIRTTADLIDRGAKILPASDANPVKESFPNYKELNLIQSAIKQIREN